MVLAWLVAVGACGSRNQLPGGSAVDGDDGDAVDGAGGNSSGSAGNTTRTTNASSTVASTSSGIAATAQASSGMANVSSSVSTTGVGGGPSCDWPDYPDGQGGAAGAPNEQASCEINFCNGWAPRAGNCANIQGAFYTYADESSGGTSTASIITSSINQICIAGEVGRVIDGRYDVYWGAGFGMNLNQDEMTAERQPYDAEYNRVTGFGVGLTGFYEGELRFSVRGEDDYYCETVAPGGGYTVFSLADLTKGCWDPVGTPHDYSRLLSLEWHFVSNADFNYDFQVCLSGLTAYR